MTAVYTGQQFSGWQKIPYRFCDTRPKTLDFDIHENIFVSTLD